MTATPTFIQSAWAGSGGHGFDVTLPAPSTAGNMLVLFATSRSGTVEDPPFGTLEDLGWTAPWTTQTTAGANCRMFWKVSEGEQTVHPYCYGDHNLAIVAEFSGVGDPDLTDLVNHAYDGVTSHAVSGSMASDGTRKLFVAGVSADHETAVPLTPDAGITELVDTAENGFWPTIWFGYRIEPAPAGSYTVGATMTGAHGFNVLSMAFPGATPVPEPGVW